ncbi:hypothetical protein CAOG_00723 [Capsaspora owczarzaki ATCC 30864]|uniref:NAD-dependent epimerase/dehydratase domain-containing protein n=1 Tax=Capsaspora owczarzaki (strain ATCC 30864) TaxID=595528 RepID=A0A0D2WJ26_CAPO3|nr:hypothetical protein CAOG_00723 [Capsaspora owczarzaki ATCC 30864]KJE89203.1 hypothetical protein CAOG_000723 [Capsaspora owczarzaki ATCC 30864]|eukprot:XP_004365594.1 hypothetical protein CAOG_00723 [Capsaspora owczarzaki ATCC 30864]
MAPSRLRCCSRSSGAGTVYVTIGWCILALTSLLVLWWLGSGDMAAVWNEFGSAPKGPENDDGGDDDMLVSSDIMGRLPVILLTDDAPGLEGPLLLEDDGAATVSHPCFLSVARASAWPAESDLNVLVIGGAGFVGSHIALRIAELPRANVVVLDLMDNSADARIRADRVALMRAKQVMVMKGDASNRQLLTQLFELQGPFTHVVFASGDEPAAAMWREAAASLSSSENGGVDMLSHVNKRLNDSHVDWAQEAAAREKLLQPDRVAVDTFGSGSPMPLLDVVAVPDLTLTRGIVGAFGSVLDVARSQERALRPRIILLSSYGLYGDRATMPVGQPLAADDVADDDAPQSPSSGSSKDEHDVELTQHHSFRWTPEDFVQETHATDRVQDLESALLKTTEGMAYAYHHLHGLMVTTLRLPRVYGPMQGSHAFLTPLLERTAKHSARRQLVELLHVNDASAAVMAAIQYGSTCDIVNAGSGLLHRVDEILDYVDNFHRGQRVPDWEQLAAAALSPVSTDRAAQLLGWQPTTELHVGLAETFNWWLDRVQSFQAKWAPLGAYSFQSAASKGDIGQAAAAQHRAVPESSPPPNTVMTTPVDLVLTCYFTSDVDPQRSESTPPNMYFYMARWYESMHELGLRGVIFHDQLSAEFVARYTSDLISFVHVSDLHHRSTNDARFYVYNAYLKQHAEVRRVLMTDISDVYFLRNPFEMMSALQDRRLLVGSDIDMFPTMKSMGWLEPRLAKCFGEGSGDPGGKVHPVMSLSQVYNAGVIGAHRSLVETLLQRICDELDATPPETNCNMAVINYVIHRWFENHVFTGYPLTSRFMRRQQAPRGVYIVHK